MPPGQIRNLLTDSQGRLWAASYRGGLCRIDEPRGPAPRFHTFTTADGLSCNETHAVVEAANGDVYEGMARGLDRLIASTGRWTHHTAHDGLPAGEMQGALRDRQGALHAAADVRQRPGAGVRVAGRVQCSLLDHGLPVPLRLHR